jgi:phenylalanyl-tRNA synthetase alpha chain
MESDSELLQALQRMADEACAHITGAQSSEQREAQRVRFVGRNGQVTLALRQLGSAPAELRPALGKLANDIRILIESLLEQRRSEILTREQQEARASERIDVTLPGRWTRAGGPHPLSQVRDEICDIFTTMGFEIVEGPEVELEYYNFEALNLPADHPARDDHDSFYFDDRVLLRTETSAVQIRTMECRRPPVRIVAPGRVYRRDAVDRTHSHTFHQVEGLLVDQDVSFAHLKGTLTHFAQRFFGDGVKMRFRPHYFPFTEPSAEVDISCFRCGGSGCVLCKQSGWIEVLGSGMVHPQVLRNVGYDPDQVSAFAFGMGIERLAILKYGVDDIRLFYENDVRFLRQLL